MTVMTTNQSELLDQLIAIAGSAELVAEALRSLNEESADAPSVPQIVRRILELRQQAHAPVAVASHK